MKRAISCLRSFRTQFLKNLEESTSCRYLGTMAPTRVGLVGLSGQPPDKYEGTSWTANAHLPFLKASPHFEIVALLNTSVESAKAAIARYELPAETKAYGDPQGKLVFLYRVGWSKYYKFGQITY